MGKLNDQELDAALSGLDGWQLQGDEISKEFKFDNFTQSMEFVNRVAAAAEDADHHPDIDIRYNKVTLTLSTHSEGGITDKDVALATEIATL